MDLFSSLFATQLLQSILVASKHDFLTSHKPFGSQRRSYLKGLQSISYYMSHINLYKSHQSRWILSVGQDKKWSKIVWCNEIIYIRIMQLLTQLLLKCWNIYRNSLFNIHLNSLNLCPFYATLCFEMLFDFNRMFLILHWRRLMQPCTESTTKVYSS